MESLQVAVRPIVTLLLTGSVCYGFLTGTVSAEAFLGLVGVVITFWFNQRQQTKDGGPKDRASDGNGVTKP